MRRGKNEKSVAASVAGFTSSGLLFDQLASTLVRPRGLLEVLLETAAQAILAIDGTGQIVLANKAFETMFGYDRDEILGQPLEILIPERQREEHVSHRARWVRCPKNRPMGVGMDLTAVRKYGEAFPVEISLSHVETDRGILAVAFITDVTERKRAEEAVRQSEERMRLAQQVSHVGTFEWNIQTGVNHWTPELEAMYGLPPGGFAGTQEAWEALVHPDDRPEAVRRVQKAMKDGDFEGEWRVTWPDGTVRWLVGRASVLRDAAGRPERLIGINMDITDLKRVQDELRESNDRFRNMADHAPVMIWMSGVDKLCNFFNKPWLEFRGRTVEQELGNGWLSGVHPDDQDRCLDIYSSSFDDRRSFRMEYRLRRANGEYRWVLDNGTPFYRDGEFTGYIGSCIDITERKVIEERLRGSETRLKDAQRLARVGSFERNIEDDKAYWSEEMFRIYGLLNHTAPSSAEFLNCVYPEDRQKLLEAHQSVRSSHAPVDIEFRIVRPNGELRCARSILEAVRDDRGTVSSFVGATQDVTDLRRAQVETFARQKLESLGTLASGIAHDFNNLLGAVLAQTELAMAELATGSHPDNELKAIRDVAIRGSEIVRQLMIYAGRDSDVVEPVDVSKVVEGMLGLLKVAVSRHADLVTNTGKGLPAVRARAAQLSQIVMNLVVNASDALGDRDGVIRMTTEHIALGRAGAIALALPAGDYVQLEVSDTGCGMSPETQAKVFDPFFTTKFSGRGLGLAVVQGIVRSLRGAIHLSSEPDRGTTFQVLLPCAETTPGASSQVTSNDKEQVAPSQNGTVLIVEDEGDLRKPIVKMLRKCGFEVFEAADGTSAIDLLRAHRGKIDVILLDMTIPGATSHEVVAEAANMRPDIRVILTSAYSQELIAGPMSSPQIRSFIRKPFQLGDLLQTLQSSFSS
jgi:PAS domain S-box-containing protein